MKLTKSLGKVLGGAGAFVIAGALIYWRNA